MHSRAVSLPDLVTEKRRNTTMSLSEGFAGFERKPALAATALGFTPFSGGSDLSAKSALGRILPVYYRTRQFVLSTEKSGQRVPAKLAGDLKKQESAVTAQGRWIFGGEGDPAWTPVMGEAVFILLSGRVGLFPEPAGSGAKTVVEEGSIFGEQSFHLADEGTLSNVASSARCEEPCMIGLLSSQVLETAFADRAFGNKRIAQMVKHVPSFHRITHPEKKHKNQLQKQAEAEAAANNPNKEKKPDLESSAILFGLRDLSTIATAVHVSSGQEVLSADSLDENVLIVSRGGLEVKADVRLTERLENLPPKRVRIRVHLEKAEKLAGDSIFDKLDPYCIVKMGPYKRFQTPVMWNVGPNPKFDYDGVLTYEGEKDLEFTVMDHDRFSADDLCGNGTLNVADLPDKGYKGVVWLTRPKRGIYKSDSTHEEDAGKIILHVQWDTEPITEASRRPKERIFPDQVLFDLKERDCWGHENLMLGPVFKRTLEQASHGMKYALSLGSFRVVGATPKGVTEVCTLWKINRRRFNEFISHCHREKQFTQACRVSALAKQTECKELLARLVRKWETEEISKYLRGGVPDEVEEEAMDPSHFRVAYRDVKCHVTVRNALNLTGGGIFDKLDPYAIVRFRGSKAPPFKTSVLEDAGSDPFWAAEGCRHRGAILYQGETAIEISVWDYDRHSADDLVATGVIPVEQFCRGFEGCVPLNLPEGKKRKANMKQMMIVVGIQFDLPRDPFFALGARTGDFGQSSTMRTAASMAQIANRTY